MPILTRAKVILYEYTNNDHYTNNITKFYFKFNNNWNQVLFFIYTEIYALWIVKIGYWQSLAVSTKGKSFADLRVKQFNFI